MHHSVRTMAAVFDGVVNRGMWLGDERAAEILIGYSLNNAPWLGPALFDFSKGLSYFYRTKGFADLTGYYENQPDMFGSPIAQLEFKFKAQINWSKTHKKSQFDTYAANHVDGLHLAVLLPDARIPKFRDELERSSESANLWTLVGYRALLECLLGHGVELPDKTSESRQLAFHLLRMGPLDE